MYIQSINRLSGTEIELTDSDGHKMILTIGLYDAMINAITKDSTAERYLNECVPKKYAQWDFTSKVCMLTGMYTAQVGKYDLKQHKFVLSKEA